MSTIKTQQKSIIVVDDEESVRTIVGRALRQSGYCVFTASSGVEALNIAAQQHFDMMFLDIRMPGMSGLNVLSHMRRKYPDTIVVMLTAVTGQASQEEANQQESFAYLTKPCNLGDITNIANRMLCENHMN